MDEDSRDNIGAREENEATPRNGRMAFAASTVDRQNEECMVMSEHMRTKDFVIMCVKVCDDV